MADVDIDPFSNHNKTDSHPDETGESIRFTQGGAMEDLLGNQDKNKKHHLEEQV